MIDGTGLVNLRARYYDPGTGRFISKDTWSGDYNNPITLVKWMYANGNPAIYTDPCGNVPTISEIKNGTQIYSCNCGFIDLGHANPSVGNQIFELLDQINYQKSNTAEGYRKDVMLLRISISPLLVLKQTVNAVVKTKNLNNEIIKDQIAYGIYREIMIKIENAQNTPWTWFTNYSFEDLASDEIGFYLSKEFRYDGDLRSSENAWSYLSSLCNFSKNEADAISNSIKVYEENNGISWIINTPKEKNWDTPKIFYTTGICTGDNGKWPKELSSMKYFSPNRNGEWWIYDSKVDGKTEESGYSGVLYLRQE